jgi:hypothetical protein
VVVVSTSLLHLVVACTGAWTLAVDGYLWEGEVLHDQLTT